jgi:hypothetical protein
VYHRKSEELVLIMPVLTARLDISACLPTSPALAYDAGWGSEVVHREKAIAKRDLVNLKAITTVWSRWLAHLEPTVLDEVVEVLGDGRFRDLGPIAAGHLSLAHDTSSYRGDFIDPITRPYE